MLNIILIVKILLNEMFKFFRCIFDLKVLIKIFWSLFFEREIFWSSLYLVIELLFNEIRLLFEMFKYKRFFGSDCGIFENLLFVKLILIMFFWKYGVVFKDRLE